MQLGHPGSRGFSVIELMVTITLLALLIAAAGPSTASWVRSAHMQNVAEAAQSGLRQARAEAMRRQRPVSFWLVTSPGASTPPDATCARSSKSASWVISLDDPSGQCGTEPSAETAPRIVVTAGVALPQGIAVAAADRDGAAANSVTFDATGRTLGAGSIARIDLTPADTSVRALRVEVSDSGAVRLCDRALTAGSDDPKACTH